MASGSWACEPGRRAVCPQPQRAAASGQPCVQPAGLAERQACGRAHRPPHRGPGRRALPPEIRRPAVAFLEGGTKPVTFFQERVRIEVRKSAADGSVAAGFVARFVSDQCEYVQVVFVGHVGQLPCHIDAVDVFGNAFRDITAHLGVLHYRNYARKQQDCRNSTEAEGELEAHSHLKLNFVIFRFRGRHF